MNTHTVEITDHEISLLGQAAFVCRASGHKALGDILSHLVERAHGIAPT